MTTQKEKKPYDLAALHPDELEALLLKRPDLTKEIHAEANRRVADAFHAAQVAEAI